MSKTIEERLNNGSIASTIKFFNSRTSTRHKVANKVNQKAINDVLEVCHEDSYIFRKFVNDNLDWIKHNHDAYGNYIVMACNKFLMEYTPAEEVPAPAPAEEVPAPAVAPAINNGVDITSLLTNLAITALQSANTDTIREKVVDLAKSEIDTYVKNNYGVVQHKVEVITPKAIVEQGEVLHEKFDLVYNLVNSNSNVYLTGPAGTGKSELCRQIANAMGLPFYCSNAITQEFKLTGYSDANGNYQPTSFYNAWVNGGVFLLDEMDASTPEVLTLLNGALANGYFDFPAPIGMVYKHENFHCMAAGNTYGEGATFEYNARNQLDASCLDRFIFIEIDYDKNIEMACANNDSDLVRFAENLRNGAKRAGIKLVVSYRALRTITKNLPIFGNKADCLKACLTKSLAIDDLNILKEYTRDCGEYTLAYDELIRKM